MELRSMQICRGLFKELFIRFSVVFGRRSSCFFCGYPELTVSQGATVRDLDDAPMLPTVYVRTRNQNLEGVTTHAGRRGGG
jgi:hypothetical protein